MFYNWAMDALDRLQLLSAQTAFDLDGGDAPQCPAGVDFSPREREHAFIHPAQLPNGRKIKLLKTLLSSACERDCYYCPFRAGRDLRRATFQPEEFAKLFAKLHRAGAVEGLFLSSGLAGGGARTQDKLLDAAEIIRSRMRFRGYLHLKLMPGVEKDQVLRAMQLADRVSVNLEAPNTARLARLAPHKQFTEELLQILRWVDELRRERPPQENYKGRWPSTVTQFVAGGADEPDLELLATTDALHRTLNLGRAYFSAFRPIPDTPLENKPPADPLRQHRLYQASFLLRDYGFALEEMPFDAAGNLPLKADPKSVWAERELKHAPVEINHADRRALLRVPGIGPVGANRILKARREQKIRDLRDLRKLGVRAQRAAPYILLDGRPPIRQLRLF